MRKRPLLVALLALAWMGQLRAQNAPPDDRELARQAAQVLLQLPAPEREAFTRRLAGLSAEERRAALADLVARHPQAEAAPDMGTQLRALWSTLPPAERQRLLAEAMKSLKSLPPDQQRTVLEQVMRLQQELANPEPPRPARPQPGPPPPVRPQERGSDEGSGELSRRLLEGLDGLLERYGEDLERTITRLEGVLGQARDYLQLYRNLPPEQRQEVMRELEDGLRILFEENILPELDDRIRGLRELRQESLRIGKLVREYLEVYRRLPEDERRQIVDDLLATGRLFLRETIRPELERQMEEWRAQLDAFRELPRAEKVRRVRELVRKLLD